MSDINYLMQVPNKNSAESACNADQSPGGGSTKAFTLSNQVRFPCVHTYINISTLAFYLKFCTYFVPESLRA